MGRKNWEGSKKLETNMFNMQGEAARAGMGKSCEHTHSKANRSFSLLRCKSLHSPWQEEDTGSAFQFTSTHIIFPICNMTEMNEYSPVAGEVNF